MDTGMRSTATQTASGSVVLVSTSQYIDHEKGVDAERPGSLGLSIAPTDETAAPPITVTPATPADADHRFFLGRESQDKIKRTVSVSGDPSAGKKVQQMLRDRVHKGQEKISTISKKIGHGVVRNGGLHLRRSNSAPGMYESSPCIPCGANVDAQISTPCSRSISTRHPQFIHAAASVRLCAVTIPYRPWNLPQHRRRLLCPPFKRPKSKPTSRGRTSCLATCGRHLQPRSADRARSNRQKGLFKKRK